MKTILLALTMAVLAVPAYAGYDHSTLNIYNETPTEATALDSNCRVPVYDLDADGDGTEDDTDTNSSGSAGFIECEDISLGTDTITYSSGLTGNPFVRGTSSFVTLANVNASAALIASATGKTIKVHGWQLYASGAMEGLTALTIDCYPGNPTSRNLVTIPQLYLSSGVRHGPGLPWTADDGTVVFASGITYTSALTGGCDAEDAVFINKTGSDGTGSDGIVIRLDYTWQ